MLKYILLKVGVLNFQRCKENNEWDKEGSQNTLKKGIREVSRKGMVCLMKENRRTKKNRRIMNRIFLKNVFQYIVICFLMFPKTPQ